jgi:hypothetical protein
VRSEVGQLDKIRNKWSCTEVPGKKSACALLGKELFSHPSQQTGDLSQLVNKLRDIDNRS